MPKISNENTFFVIMHDITIKLSNLAHFKKSGGHDHLRMRILLMIGRWGSLNSFPHSWVERQLHVYMYMYVACNHCLQHNLPGMDGVQLIVGCVALLFLSFSTVCCGGKFAW